MKRNKKESLTADDCLDLSIKITKNFVFATLILGFWFLFSLVGVISAGELEIGPILTGCAVYACDLIYITVKRIKLAGICEIRVETYPTHECLIRMKKENGEWGDWQ